MLSTYELVMNLIPLLKTKDITHQKQIADLFTSLNDTEKTVPLLYLLDNNGINKNHPCLSLYQYSHRWFNTIVDAGCHHVGDVVDVLLAGAHIVVIRPKQWKESDLLSIRDISEAELYVWYDPFENDRKKSISSVLLSQADGIIFYTDEVMSPISFEIRDTIKALISTHSAEKIMVFDSQQKHERELSSFGLNSMIVDSQKIQRENSYV